MNDTEQIRQDVENVINEDPALRQMWAQIFGVMPRYVYWESPTKRLWFCYNTEPFTPSHKSKGRKWGAWIYRTKKAKHGTELTMGKVMYFSQRQKAKKRAFQWYEKSVQENLKRAQKARDQAFGTVATQ